MSADQRVSGIGVSLGQEKDIRLGRVTTVEPRPIVLDLDLRADAIGGPVFAADGAVIGITSLDDATSDTRRRERITMVRASDACEVLAAAETKMTSAVAPSGTLLPVEPTWTFPDGALEQAAQRRVGSLNPYQISTSAFDVAFITPVMTYGVGYQAQVMARRAPGQGGRADGGGVATRPNMDFGNWSDYVADFKPVLLIRVTPKMVQGFWASVARGAAMTQGIGLPPLKHIDSSFAGMRVFCGDMEVTPIHPFTLEQRLTEKEAVSVGLYVFDPDQLGPTCGSVKLVLFSEKELQRGETRAVDPGIVNQIDQDFALRRTQR